MHADSRIKRHLPFSYYYWAVVVIAAIGLIDSIYLSISHYRVYMDMGYMSFCAISKALNCDTVSQSRYAVFLGVPLAVWGIVGYAFFISLLLIAGKQKPKGQRIWPSLFFVSILFSIISIALAVISSLFIQSYCLMCILSFGVNFMLIYFIWLIRKRFDPSGLKQTVSSELLYWKQRPITGGLIVVAFAVVSFSLIGFYPKYWDASTALSVDVKTGITEDGHPWIGAADPKYTITEFTDYQCFQCKKIHSYLRLIVARNSHQVRLIHRHFPMDHRVNPIVDRPYHIGSGKMALVAIYASIEGKFWEMNDMLFKYARQKEALNIKEIADDINLDLSNISNPEIIEKTRRILSDDIEAGIRLGFDGTPGYLFDGVTYSGQLPPDIIQRITGKK